MTWSRPLLPFTDSRPPSRPTEQGLRPIQLRPPKIGQDATSRGKPAADGQQWLLCGICAARITHQDQTVSINDRHQHVFFNPDGIVFEIRCFQTAHGTVLHDQPSTEFTWFPGYSWQIALCGTCKTHLGWRFAKEPVAHTFFGLIASRLLEL